MSKDIDDPKRLLRQLGEQTETVPFSKLYSFSDLAGERLVGFCGVWDSFPAAQRRRLIQGLVELAEASFQVNFDAIFRHCMSDPDEEVRAAAIEGLWENEEVALIGPLLTMLRADPSIRVRAAAAAGLGRFVLASELEELEASIQARIMNELLTSIYLVDESIEVRRRALESVAYICMPEVIEALELAYYDEDERMRISAVVGMGRSCDKRWKEIVLAELESSSEAMRYEAALASGGLMLRAAVPILARLLNDADPQVRDASIWSLGQIGGDQAKRVLMSAYEEADDDTRVILDEALAEQALLEGNVEFVLYELDEDHGDDLFDDELLTLWNDDELDDDETDEDDWEF